ncbi:TPA: riboflavin biosynthesis protein RibD [Candidatus Gastranaerophilales bacterium HUM_2]|nr:MAG TPA: riboflavin biosynthesis protein RibD [Candidatus Gastranaerophilales bacterium HUM_2]
MNYENYMKKCIELAKNGEGQTSPNPMVGCVVLDKNENEISTGYHHKYGDNHAERDALLKLHNGEEKGGTLIVNLEPCSHHGKTPPCADLIIERGLKKVVIGMQDVNPIVAGNGINKLQKAGIEVISGIMEEECKKLNEIFIKNMTQNKCFIAIKTATTLDGKIATSNGSSKWITSSVAREKVKEIRNCYDAIMTTSSTILADNPTMLHRKKIILDRRLKTNLEAPIYKNGEIYLFNETLDMFEGGVNFIKTPVIANKLDLEFVFERAYELGIKSILIESGGILNGSALKYTDKIYHFIAPKITGDNSSLSCFNFQKINDINNSLNFKIESIEHFEPDILLTYYPINQ